MFMRHQATRIVELDRGRIFSWSCDYQTFLERKQMALETEEVQRHGVREEMSREEVWIRKGGVKARRVRNEGRVKALERMREDPRKQRQAVGKVNMQAQEAEAVGHLVIKVFQPRAIGTKTSPWINNLSTTIMRGDKIGRDRPKRARGKTTLLRLLLGQMTPLRGKSAPGDVTRRSRITTSCANSSMKKNGDGECQRRERYHHDQR